MTKRVWVQRLMTAAVAGGVLAAIFIAGDVSDVGYIVEAGSKWPSVMR